MTDDELEDYGFEYSDEDPDEADVDAENQYYFAKALLEAGSFKDAFDGFSAVLVMEKEPGEWGFKALKQIVKLHLKHGDYEDMLITYRQLLKYVSSAVTRNYSEKVLNSIIDAVSVSPNAMFRQEFYETTLCTLEDDKNARLCFKTNLKLCNLWLSMKEFVRVGKLIKKLHQACLKNDGSFDQQKGTQILEVYAIEIQMYTEQKNNKRLKETYLRALTVTSAIPHPHILGIIRECGGKMHMAERQWGEAATDFFESFKSYDEAGQSRRIQSLKYLVIANMLMESDVNPFDAQETRSFRSDPEVVVITSLVSAYHRNSISDFEALLITNNQHIIEDPFIHDYVEELLKNLRTQVLLKLIKPYTRVRFSVISSELNIPEVDVEALLVCLVLDSRVEADIDQTTQTVALGAYMHACRGSRNRGWEKWAAFIKAHTRIQTLRIN